VLIWYGDGGGGGGGVEAKATPLQRHVEDAEFCPRTVTEVQ